MRTLICHPLRLEPLTVAHADGMFPVLADPALYEHLDYGPPPNVEHVRSVYAQLQRGRSPDGTEVWLNWVALLEEAPIGFVQATVLPSNQAWVAYVFQRATAGRGLARAAVRAMLQELASAYGVEHFLASVEQANARSIRLLEALHFRPASAEELVGHRLSESERLFVRAPVKETP